MSDQEEIKWANRKGVVRYGPKKNEPGKWSAGWGLFHGQDADTEAEAIRSLREKMQRANPL